MKTQPIPREQIDAMYAYYREGHSTRQTGRKFGVACSTVSRCFRRCGYPVRNRIHGMLLRQRTHGEALQMYREWQSGISTRAIAAKYHYTQSSVWKKMRRLKKSGRAGSEVAA